MADIDCHGEMTAFHREQVTLSRVEQDEMRSRRDAGRTRLQTGLHKRGHPQPRFTHSQGSYAMRTMTQDAANDYDIDDGVYFDDARLVDVSGNRLTPSAARQRVRDALAWDRRLDTPATVKSNCVRQVYPRGYHIDVPVYRIVTVQSATGDDVEQYELASGDRWVRSDARAVTAWFNQLVGELNSGQSDGSQMRRVTKLTKKFARRTTDWKARTTSGICMTKLVVDHFVACAGRDDKALHDTWSAISAALRLSTQIDHPVQTDVRLADPGDSEVDFFRTCLAQALEELKVLDSADCTRRQARLAWDNVFGTSFFVDQPDDDPGSRAKAPVFVVTSGQTARRDDGGGRFG